MSMLLLFVVLIALIAGAVPPGAALPIVDAGTSSRFASTDTDDPPPGLIVQGTVRHDGADRAGLPGVTITKGYASYPFEPIAITGVDGTYRSHYDYIPGDEMVTVGANAVGYLFDPPQYLWRHYHGLEVATCDFVAYPLTTNCTTPPANPYRLLVSRYDWQTDQLTSTLTIWPDFSSGQLVTTTVVTVVSEAGSITTSVDLSSPSGVTVIVPLRPRTVHHLVVSAEIRVPAGCTYLTHTRYDDVGTPLVIRQQPRRRIFLSALLLTRT
jgi:hypothetical protein